MRGHGDLLAVPAKCCRPLPGDEIVGYITRGRGRLGALGRLPERARTCSTTRSARSRSSGRAQDDGHLSDLAAASRPRTSRACWPGSPRRSPSSTPTSARSRPTPTRPGAATIEVVIEVSQPAPPRAHPPGGAKPARRARGHARGGHDGPARTSRAASARRRRSGLARAGVSSRAAAAGLGERPWRAPAGAAPCRCAGSARRRGRGATVPSISALIAAQVGLPGARGDVVCVADLAAGRRSPCRRSRIAWPSRNTPCLVRGNRESMPKPGRARRSAALGPPGARRRPLAGMRASSGHARGRAVN